MRRSASTSTFSARALGWLIGLGVLSFAIRVGMGAFGEDLVEPSTPAPSAFSYSALGHRALVVFLEERGVPVLIRQDPTRAHGGPQVPELFSEPDLDAMEGQDSSLGALVDSARRHDAPVVLVLPKWSGTPDENRLPPWVDEVSLQPVSETTRMLSASGVEEIRDLDVVRAGDVNSRCGGHDVSLEQAQFLELGRDENMVSAIACDGGTLVAYADPGDGGPPVWIVADPDLLSNHGLSRAGHAALVEDLFVRRIGARALVADEAVHGFRRRVSLMTQLARFPLVLGTLHGVMVLGLVLWAGVGRFGKPRPIPPARLPGKEALIENTAQLLAAGGHTAETLARYFSEAVRAVAVFHAIPPELPAQQAKARLQAITASRKLRFRIAEAERAIGMLADRASAGSPHRALRIAIAIHGWRQEMTNER